MRRPSIRVHHRLVALGVAGAVAIAALTVGGLVSQHRTEGYLAEVVRHRTVLERDARALGQAVERVEAASAARVVAVLREDGAGVAAATREADTAWLAQYGARRALAQAFADRGGDGSGDEAHRELVTALARWEDAHYRDTAAATGDGGIAEVVRARDAVVPHFAQVHAAVAAVERILDSEAEADLAAIRSELAAQRERTLAALAAMGGVLVVATGLLSRRTRREEAAEEAAEAVRRLDADRTQFESELQRGLEMVNDESSSFHLVRAALVQRGLGPGAELLLADSSRAHLHQVLHTGDGEGTGCPVGSPLECPAASRGQTMVFPSSGSLDACPHLRDRPGGPCSATCVPVSIAGKTIGILHVTGADGEARDDVAVRDLEVVGRRASERLTLIRAFAESSSQASTDPLTGLFNRRTLEARARELHEDQGDTSYAVAYGDLDHFKLLNDVHGHEGGDRALRLFAGVLRDGVRSVDVASRYGGEEFVVLLPRCSAAEAASVITRVRERLAAALGAGRVPSFTASFGIATSAPGATFAEVLNAADQALLAAKAAGRDRIVLADDAPPPPALQGADPGRS